MSYVNGKPSDGKRTIDLWIWLHLNWGPLIASIVVLWFTIPYLFSPFDLIIHNAMDEALIEALGIIPVKSIMAVSFILGGVLGLTPVRFYLSLFRWLREGKIFVLDRALHGVAIIAPNLGYLSQLIYSILSRTSPTLAPYEWGPVVNILFVMPALGFMIVSAAGWLFLRYRTERRSGKKLKFQRVVGEEKTFEMKLVDISC